MSGVVPLAKFACEIVRRADAGPRFRRRPDTLSFAVALVRASPAAAQSVALARVIVALVDGQGEFRSAEVFAFDADHTALLSDLVSARLDGGFAETEWQAARVELLAVLLPAGHEQP